MSKLRLHVVTIGVSDFSRSVRFYEDLGFERRMKETGDAIAFFDAGGMIVSLFRWDMLAEDAHAEVVAPCPPAFRGIALARMCRTDKDVDALMSKALCAGATLLKHARKTTYGGYSGYFADPDGHAWEVCFNPQARIADDGSVWLPR